jgi:hypothetical protein
MSGDESELRPCPFCGQEPQSNTLNAWCNGPIDNPHGAINLQRAAWNTRPAPVTDESELIERLSSLRSLRDEYQARAITAETRVVELEHRLLELGDDPFRDGNSAPATDIPTRKFFADLTDESELKPVARQDGPAERHLNFRGVGYTESLSDWRKSYSVPADGPANAVSEAAQAAALLQLQQERDAAQADGDRMLNAERQARVEIARQAMALALELKALEAEVERLRAALTEARQFINEDSPDWRYAKLEMLERIDRALNGDKS